MDLRRAAPTQSDRNKSAANVYVDSHDWPGVLRAAGDLQSDIKKVSGIDAVLRRDDNAPGGAAIFIGTIGKSALIDRLIAEKKLDVTGVTGKWESFRK